MNLQAHAADSSVACPLSEPLIVVGAVRSGTTLLRLLLDGHPDIRVIGEFEESVKWLPETGWIEVDHYRALLSLDRVFLSRGAPLPTATTYPEAVKELLETYFVPLESSVLPGFAIHNHIHRIADLWPDARFVHIVRDPRDVARSCIVMGWSGHVWQASETWLRAEQQVGTLAARLGGEQMIRVRYEDLVIDPRRELGRIIDFLDLRWHENIFSAIDRSTYDRPDSTLIQQWRHKLSAREVELVESRCQELMMRWGYIPEYNDPLPPAGPEKALLKIVNRWKRWQSSRKRYGFVLASLQPLIPRLPLDSPLRSTLQKRLNEINTRRLK